MICGSKVLPRRIPKSTWWPVTLDVAFDFLLFLRDEKNNTLSDHSQLVTHLRSLWLVYFTIKKHTLGKAVWHDRIWKIGHKSQFSCLYLDYVSLRALSSICSADFKAYFRNDFGELWLSCSQPLVPRTRRSFHSLEVRGCPWGQIRNLFNLCNGLATVTETVSVKNSSENESALHWLNQ